MVDFNLNVRVPQAFLTAVNAHRQVRYIGTYVVADKAMLSTGVECRTYSFYSAYSPLIEHPLIYWEVAKLDAYLGSADSDPTHILLIDTQDGKMAIWPYEEAQQFLRSQHTEATSLAELSSEELQAATEEFLSQIQEPTTLEDFQRMGMFEFFGPSDPETWAQICYEMDMQVTEEWLEEALEATNSNPCMSIMINPMISRFKQYQHAAQQIQ